MYTLRFDMRAPAGGASADSLYRAAPEMCAWAEQRGCIAAVLCEHHGSDDGYLPSPMVLASAIASRTEKMMLTLTVILPFYDPVRLAEDIAVLDLISNGRASYIFGLGYRAEEFAHFGVDIHDRGRLADEKITVLRRLLAGHTVDSATLTPRPLTPGGPMLMWGGGSVAAARRAGRYGLGLLANGKVSGMQEAYEAACRAHGFEPGLTVLPDRDTPTVCFVADDVDHAWDEIGHHLLHDARMYAQWNPGNDTSAGISAAESVADLRDTSASHRIFAVSEAVEFVHGGGLLNLAPLCGGLPPEIAWPYLRRVAEVVLPEVSAAAV
ncbi:LLM class flavin-dependent oxidoreductase [Mycobacterium sp. 4D054]|uniref:LLM class flavin-dependent oxidoreductase n=1 Tax=Mycobacterium sp. 4D054 TaxID=3457440 RepID=UPI003FD61830